MVTTAHVRVPVPCPASPPCTLCFWVMLRLSSHQCLSTLHPPKGSLLNGSRPPSCYACLPSCNPCSLPPTSARRRGCDVRTPSYPDLAPVPALATPVIGCC